MGKADDVGGDFQLHPDTLLSRIQPVLTKLFPILGVNSWMLAPEDRHKVFSKAALARVALLSLQVLTAPLSKSTSLPKSAGKLQGKFLYGSHPIAFPYPPHGFCSVMTSYCSLCNDLRLSASP